MKNHHKTPHSSLQDVWVTFTPAGTHTHQLQVRLRWRLLLSRPPPLALIFNSAIWGMLVVFLLVRVHVSVLLR